METRVQIWLVSSLAWPSISPTYNHHLNTGCTDDYVWDDEHNLSCISANGRPEASTVDLLP
jgi:hypothetical protein